MQVPLPQVSDQGPPPSKVSSPPISPMQDGTGAEIQRQGQALSSLGDGLARIAIDINEQHATATAKAALNKWSEYADQSDLQYRSQLGAAATEIDGKPAKPGDAPARVSQALEQRISEIEQGMSSDLAKRVFRQHAERSLVGYRGRLAAHEVKQIQIHERAEGVAAANQKAQSYINGNPQAFAEAVAEAEGVATGDGLGPKARAAFLLNLKTGMHAGYVSRVLSEEGAVKADEALRAIPKEGEIDAKTRGQLRAKVDEALTNEKVDKLGVDIVANEGHRTHGDRVEAARKALPGNMQADIAKGFALKAAKDMGATPRQLEDLEKTGGWRALLTTPEVVAKIPEAMRTLDQEIILARYPGKPPAGSGTLGRGLATAKEAYDKGEIDARGLRKLQAVIAEQVRFRALARGEAEAEALHQTELVLQGGKVTAIDSPSFPAELRETLSEHGLLDDARRLQETVSQRASDPAFVDDMFRAYADGSLGKLSYSQLKSRYYTKMSARAWAETEQRWDSLQPAPGKAGVKASHAQKFDVDLRRWAGSAKKLSGVDNKFVAMPGDADEANWYIDLKADLDDAIEASGRTWSRDDALKWASQRALEDIRVAKPDNPFAVSTMARQASGGPARVVRHTIESLFGGPSTEVVNRPEVEAQIRRLFTVPDPDGEEATIIVDGQPVVTTNTKAQELYRQLQANIVVKVGSKMVRTIDGKQAVGTAGDPIPQRAAQVISDAWRISQFDGALRETVQSMVIEAGGLSRKAKRDNERIEEILGGIPKWPPIDYQVKQWGVIRAKYRPDPVPDSFGDPEFNALHLGY